MKISNIKNNISFQKTLHAKANVLKNGEAMPCTIYSIDSDDKYYFVYNLPGWENAKYYKQAKALAESIVENRRGYTDDIYVIEDEKEKCIGFAITSEASGISKNIDFLEVIPKYAGGDKEKEVKYIGETMLSFLAKNIKRTKLKELYVFSADKKAKDFYTKKCGFKEEDDRIINSVYLPKESFDNLIQQNEKHTKGGIEIVAEQIIEIDLAGKLKSLLKKIKTKI